MKTESNRQSLEALKNMLSETDLILSTTTHFPRIEPHDAANCLAMRCYSPMTCSNRGGITLPLLWVTKGEHDRQAPRR